MTRQSKPFLTDQQRSMLQNELVTCCEQGDIKSVIRAIQKGAKPDIPNTMGKYPLGASVWGMNPGVVNTILQQMGGTSSMDWVELEKHNLAYYKQLFVVSKFNPQSYEEWLVLVRKLDLCPFVCEIQLNAAKQMWPHDENMSWDILTARDESRLNAIELSLFLDDEDESFKKFIRNTTIVYQGFRQQIKKGIEIAARGCKRDDSMTQKLSLSYNQQRLLAKPRAMLHSEQLVLQNKLIAACEQGDIKAVKEAVRKGTKPDMTNEKGKHPVGSAVWSMIPEVINFLLQEMGGISPMTWEEFEKHNLKNYNNSFIISTFSPKNFDEWNELLRLIDSSVFLRRSHLGQVNTVLGRTFSSWESFKQYMNSCTSKVRSQRLPKGCRWVHLNMSPVHIEAVKKTEKEYIAYQLQIRQWIESAVRPQISLV